MTTTNRLADRDALDAIARSLSGVEWTADTVADVAQLVALTGRTVADVGQPLCRCCGTLDEAARTHRPPVSA